MAIYISNSYGRRRNRTRNRIYIVSAALVIAAVGVFIYGNSPFGRSEAPSYLPPVKAGEATEATTVESGPAESVEQVEEPSAPVAPPAKEPALIKVGPEPAVQSSPQVAKLIAEADSLLKEQPSRIIEARERLNEALSMPMTKDQQVYVRKQLSQLAQTWLFSRSVFGQDRLCESYKVRPGDMFSTIGAKYKVPYGILQEINNIPNAQQLKAGDTIKVIKGPFHARVYRSTFTMDLFLQDTYVRSFSVGLGMPGRETPRGSWRVKAGDKQISPMWTDPDTHRTYKPDDPDYPLGSRWIGLQGLEGEAKGRTGIAFHGTKDPDAIGKAGSRGCIRLYNGDVILLYNLLVPTHSKVEVVD
ncbi:MAG: L,D-transpeptidase family protein [Planctomycetota bacterium]|jgi:LysM repeat protein